MTGSPGCSGDFTSRLVGMSLTGAGGKAKVEREGSARTEGTARSALPAGEVRALPVRCTGGLLEAVWQQLLARAPRGKAHSLLPKVRRGPVVAYLDSKHTVTTGQLSPQPHFVICASPRSLASSAPRQHAITRQ